MTALALFLALLLLPSLALAAEPTVIAGDGGSVWSYQDAYDETAKREGAYRLFDEGVLYASDGAAYDTAGGWVDQAAYAGKGPHGGYDTTTNKCKSCHAVHRAEGTYYLLRATSSDDACSYCHIGGSAHSERVVYDSNDAGIYTANGHTMGAGSQIPDSAISMETRIVTVPRLAGDLEVPVRAYSETRKSLYRIVGYGRSPAGHPSFSAASPRFSRIGPTSLSCSNCHQTHNATALVWKPQAFDAATDVVDAGGFLVSGYKLLRRYPGASALGDPAAGAAIDDENLAKVPESRLVVNFNYSDAASLEASYLENGIDTRQPDWVVSGGFAGGEAGSATVVNQYTLSVWCADCHNLNIGGTAQQLGDAEMGFTVAHADRTHPVPSRSAFGGSTGGFQCYSCHRADLDYGSACNMCHYNATNYRTRVASVGTDFPHAAAADGYKLLGNYSWARTENPETNPDYPLEVQPIGPENLDAVCIRCHDVDNGGHGPFMDAEHTVPAACVTCHDADASIIHESAPAGCNTCHALATATLQCSTCHPGQANPDGSVIEHGYIAADHQAAGSGLVEIFADFGHDDAAWTGANAGAPTPHFAVQVDCTGCHSSDLGSVHDKRCSVCHSGLVQSLGTWNGTCSGGGCHATYHAESTVAHEPWEDPYFSGIDCYLCHDPSGWWPTQSGCANCHLTNNPGDTTPPVTSSDLLPTYLGPALIDFSITDSGKVGVGTTYSRLDGGPAVAGDTRYVTAPGTHTLDFWSVDQYGNVEVIHTTASFTIVADTVAPVTTSNAQPLYYSGTTITLTPTDASTLGVKTTYYTLNGGAQQTGTSVAIPPTPSGTIAYTLVYWSVDWTGNVEPPNTATFNVVGGTRIIRLTWGDADLYGLNDPNADAYWTIRRGLPPSGVVVATGSGSYDTGWDGVDDYAVSIGALPYYVEVWWWNTDFDDYDLTIFWPVDVSTGGDPIRLMY